MTQTRDPASPGALPIPMTVAVDGYNLALPRGTGVATYGIGLVKAIRDMGCAVDGVFGLNAGDERKTRELLFFDAFAREQPFGRAERKRYVRRAMWRTLLPLNMQQIPMTDDVEKRGIGDRFPTFERLFNYPYLFQLASARFKLTGSFLPIRVPNPPQIMHWTYPVPVRMLGAKNVYTLHDLVPLRLPYTTLDDKQQYRKLIATCIETSDHICTVSEASRTDILQHFAPRPDKVTNTYQTCPIPDDIRASNPEDDAKIVQELFGLKRRGYFLFFGALDPKKNVDRILEAYLKSRCDLPLVVVLGRDWGMGVGKKFEGEGGKDGDPGRRGKVIQLDYLSRPMLFRLIRTARAVVFPSLYEGFGLPVLEALQLGTPAITSNLSSLPEVAGEAGVLVDPYSTAEIASALRILEGDDELYRKLLGAQPAQTAKFCEAAYEERLRDMYAKVLSPER